MRRLTTIGCSLLLGLGLALPVMAQGVDPTELNNFETFLNNHPNTARELQQNPNLVNDPNWIKDHKGFREFMNDHPGVRNEIHGNPGAFMNDEGHWMSNNGGFGGPANNSVERFDRGYLDEHPEVADQLAHNPGLADNQQYLAAHPGLDDYMKAHPQVRQDLIDHPKRFMSYEDQLNGHPGSPYPAPGQYHPGQPPAGYNGGPGAPPPGYNGNWPGAHNPNALGTADNYFYHHPDVYHQMQQDPRLVDNQHYVDSHPGLQDYLGAHPYARKAFKDHPDAFMHAEEHYQEHHHHN